MRVLVTGATGFVGSHTVAALRAAGHAVRVLVRDPAKLERVFATRGGAPRDVVMGDVVDADSVAKALTGCDGVVHAAALVALEAVRATRVLETNARAVELVVGGAARRGIDRIVYVSSVGALFRPGGPPVDVDAPVAPARSAYARSKADAERYVRGLQAEGAPVRISYPAAVLGPDDPELSESNRALRTFVRDTMVITSGGFQLIDVRDLARVHERLLVRGEGPARYLVAGHYHTWSQMADLVDSVTGVRVRRIPLPGVLLRGLGHLGDVVKRVYDFDFPLTGESMAFASGWRPVDDARTRAELGVAYRAPRDTVADALRWMARAGRVDPRCVGRLADGREPESPRATDRGLPR